MNCDNQLSFTSSLNTKKNLKSCSLCKVCGIDNAQLHYGTLCCVSCKMFFRRNAQINLNDRKCIFHGKCDITIKSRKTCRYCRLKKCFLVGMQKELLRASHNRQGTRCKQYLNNKITSSASCIYPIDLLKNDRSLLTTEQWSYLSNLINLFNIKFPVSDIHHLLEDQSKYPMKMRLKMATTNMLLIISTMYQGVLPFIKNLSHFQTLSLNDQSALIKRNTRNIGGYSGIVISRDVDIHSSPIFKTGFPLIYGSKIMDNAIKIYKNADNDGTLIKLLMPVLVFSTACDIIVMDENNNKVNVSTDEYRLLSNEKKILDIQNFYTEILFKYMIYRYGYQQASLRFAALIKTSLDQSMCSLNGREVQKHKQLMQTIVKTTEQSLILQDDN
ncbi:unnamed protein product [Rotaria sordida]|uniref:Nuclear receptor domain-containing protein n=1 Tax=Rotaria sordida TaxID=392033 RepID=A0A818IU44_9BILA|nr:unnamed protein product [Rotaria sordida]CAF3529894.1 unnamed protein product [Rotaria sordida]